MAKTEAEVRAIINRYVDFLAKELNVKRVILFGSYARDTATEDSDIDIAIESPDFGDNYVKDWQKLYRCVWRSGVEPIIEPRPLHPGINSMINEEIEKNGIVIYEAELSRKSN